MVDLDDRLKKIKERFVDRGKYFIINRGRQYGKTTTLRELAGYLKDEYLVLSMDFQEIGTDEFQNEAVFSRAFTEILFRELKKVCTEEERAAVIPLISLMKNGQSVSLRELFVWISELCNTVIKSVVLVIDEVDRASNHQVFLDFLAMLRSYYLDRKNKPTFHSVILAGVYDIKNLKLKIRPKEEHRYNSPWNIAARFNMDMSFSAGQIASMLQEYENDKRTGMDVYAVGTCIYEYTSGYPYLVSAICKFLDEEIVGSEGFGNLASAWTRVGIAEAVKMLLSERNPLFDSMIKQFDIFKNLRNMLEDMLYQGKEILYSPEIESVNIGMMLGLLKEEDNHVAIANRIFEMRLLNLFLTEESACSEVFRYGQRERSQFIRNSRLDMDLVLEKFVEYFTDLYSENDEKFV